MTSPLMATYDVVALLFAKFLFLLAAAQYSLFVRWY
jgi:hypothetical protein